MCFRLPRRESEGTTHVGRGGAANIAKVPTRGGEEESSSVEGKEGKEVKEEKEVKGKGKGKGKANEGVTEEGVVERGRRWVAGLVRRGSHS